MHGTTIRIVTISPLNTFVAGRRYTGKPRRRWNNKKLCEANECDSLNTMEEKEANYKRNAFFWNITRARIGLLTA